jgi:hypothetical protein
MISPSRIAELRKMVDEATPGPWFFGKDRWGVAVTIRDTSGAHDEDCRHVEDGKCAGCWDDPTEIIATAKDSTTPGDQFENDGAFIAACREAVPALLDEIERLQKIEERANELLDVFAQASNEKYRHSQEGGLTQASRSLHEGIAEGYDRAKTALRAILTGENDNG